MSKLNIPRPSSDEWLTPISLFRSLDYLYKFTLDPCACKGHELKEDITNYYNNGLNREWFGRVFCNPPYYSHIIEKWIQKGIYEITQKNIELVCYLLPVKTDQRWFYTINKFLMNRGTLSIIETRLAGIKCIEYTNDGMYGDSILFLQERLKFRKPNSRPKNAPFENMIVVLRA